MKYRGLWLPQIHVVVEYGFMFRLRGVFPVNEPCGHACRTEQEQDERQLFHS